MPNTSTGGQSLQQLIQALLGGTLAQPVDRSTLIGQAHTLFDPTYNTMTDEATGDYGTERSRLVEDDAFQRGLLARAKENQAVADSQDTGALTERLATMGLGATGGIGDMKREALKRSQIIAGQGLGDQESQLNTGYNRGVEDWQKRQFRGLRDITQKRSQAIEGYATDPRFMFPTTNFS